jgi:potassium/chloride transporter 9
LNKAESAISIQSYVTIVEDLILRLQVNVAIAKGFPDLELPTPGPNRKQSFLNTLGFAYTGDEGPSKKYIDLWPIQMSAEIATSGEDFTKKNALTTNFDTYTLILQLGCILNTVPSWKRTYKLRVCVFVEYESDVDEERGRVETLLRNLRIQAEVKVFWLASGDLKMYNVITNGSRAEDDELARKDVDDALQDEKWWQDILRLKDPQNLTSREEVSQAEDLLNAVNNWPNASFQHGRRESQPKRFARLKKMLRRRKSSIGDLVAAGLTLGMHSQRLPAELVSGSESSSDGEDDDDDRRDNEGRGEDEEAVTTESEDNLADYDLDASSEENDTERPTTARRRAKSLGTVTMNIPFMNRSISLRKSPYKHEDEAQKQDRPTAASVTPLKPHQDAAVSDTALLGGRKPDTMTSGITASSPNLRAKVEPGDASKRPRPTRHQSIPKFTSGPTPRTAVAAEETAGPSIMFVDSPSPNTARKEDPLDAAGALRGTTPSHASAQPTLPARPQPQPPTGYPISSALPLSFNDLPCRAQHLILNELIRKNSEDTAVVFTTLPSPMEGVCESEAESVQFISDLEVLTLGLPPCLLVHSNSMTVTMNL